MDSNPYEQEARLVKAAHVVRFLRTLQREDGGGWVSPRDLELIIDDDELWGLIAEQAEVRPISKSTRRLIILELERQLHTAGRPPKRQQVA